MENAGIQVSHTKVDYALENYLDEIHHFVICFQLERSRIEASCSKLMNQI